MFKFQIRVLGKLPTGTVGGMGTNHQSETEVTLFNSLLQNKGGMISVPNSPLSKFVLLLGGTTSILRIFWAKPAKKTPCSFHLFLHEQVNTVFCCINFYLKGLMSFLQPSPSPH